MMINVLLALCAFGASAEIPGPDEPPVRNETTAAVQTPETVVQQWPERSRGAALALIEKYGEPDLFDEDSLTWDENGPWDETVVYREAPLVSIEDDGRNILKQSIDYDADVPEKKIAALGRFDARVEFDPETGELSAQSEGENLNYLALNLADEIVSGKRTADQAKDFYLKTTRLAAAGKMSPYMEGFLFPRSARPADQLTR